MDTEYINIVMDAGPHDPTTGFVECETDEGKSINAGKWIKRPDGFWALRLLVVKEDNR